METDDYQTELATSMPICMDVYTHKIRQTHVIHLPKNLGAVRESVDHLT